MHLLKPKNILMETLKQKHVLIAGATGAIGSHTAKLLAASGARLFLTGRNAEKLKAVAISCNVAAENTFVANLTLAGSVDQLFEQYMEQMPVIDTLILASGTGIIKPFEQLTEADFMASFQANLFAPFLMLKKFLPIMKTAGSGHIIYIPGVLGKVPMAGAAAYSASKYGLVGMMQSIREEVKRTPIRLTSLVLGGTDSGFWDAIDLKVQREKMLNAEEVARAIWFLCQQPISGVAGELVLQPFNHQAV